MCHLEEEDVGALHAGIEDLRSRHITLPGAPHDLGAPGDPLHCVAPGDVHDQGPVLRCTAASHSIPLGCQLPS